MVVFNETCLASNSRIECVSMKDTATTPLVLSSFVFFFSKKPFHLEHHTVGHWTNENTIWRVDYLPQNKTQCSTSKTGGVKMPDPWAWIPSASYVGQQTHHGITVDVWGWNDTATSKRYEVAVADGVPNVPLFTAVEDFDQKGALQIRFEERISNFTTTINSTYFQKPKECS